MASLSDIYTFFSCILGYGTIIKRKKTYFKSYIIQNPHNFKFGENN